MAYDKRLFGLQTLFIAFIFSLKEPGHDVSTQFEDTKVIQLMHPKTYLPFTM